MMSDLVTDRIAAISPESWSSTLNRRSFLTGSAAVAAATLSAKLAWDAQESFFRSRVFIGRAQSYNDDLARVIRTGLVELGLGKEQFRGKTILLKPNLVEPSITAPHINTHPLVVAAAVEVFRGWRARDVFVAEGPGHCRDTQIVLETSGLSPVLHDLKAEFVDLNLDDTRRVTNVLGFTRLQELHLPRSLERADWIVSLPKLKTHHWAGVTLSLKNMFGVLPGVCYGWPKNVLHHQGITESIMDINATVRPHLAIADGIVGMEGDGPLMGTPKLLGALVIGSNLTAVDATAARLMGIAPERVPHFAAAAGRLGPIASAHIEQRGETLAAATNRFQLVPQWASLASDQSKE